MKATDSPEIVTYSTFVQDLRDSKITDVSIYAYGGDVDLTYTTAEGVLRGAKGAIGLDDDYLLSTTLTSQEVPFTIHDGKFDGAGSSWGWAIHLGSFAFFLIPILMLLVISSQAKTIKTLATALSKSTERKEAEQGGDGDAEEAV